MMDGMMHDGGIMGGMVVWSLVGVMLLLLLVGLAAYMGARAARS